MSQVIKFPRPYQESACQGSGDSELYNLVVLEEWRVITLPGECRERMSRSPPPLPFIRKGPATQAALLTAEMRGSKDSPGKWPGLGLFLMALITERLESGRLNDFQAKRLVDAIQSRLEHLDLADVSPESLGRVVAGGEGLRNQIIASDVRLLRYANAFAKACARHLKFAGMELDEFQRCELWKQDYEPVLQTIFLCVEPQLATHEVKPKTESWSWHRMLGLV